MSSLILEQSLQFLSDLAEMIWPFDYRFHQISSKHFRERMERVRNRLVRIQSSIQRHRSLLRAIDQRLSPKSGVEFDMASVDAGVLVSPQSIKLLKSRRRLINLLQSHESKYQFHLSRFQRLKKQYQSGKNVRIAIS